MRPIYTAFYTTDTLYEHEAARLRASLVSHSLETDIVPIAPRGSWQANTAYTATHLRLMLDKHKGRPVVYLDADAVVWEYPWLFDDLKPETTDIAVHYRKGHELLNGTLWLGNTEACRQVIALYEQFVQRAGQNCTNEQKMLDGAIDEMSDLLKVYKLPAAYAWIHDLMKEDLNGEEPVIEHLQASRETHISHLTENRRKRLREIEGYSWAAAKPVIAT